MIDDGTAYDLELMKGLVSKAMRARWEAVLQSYWTRRFYREALPLQTRN